MKFADDDEVPCFDDCFSCKFDCPFEQTRIIMMSDHYYTCKYVKLSRKRQAMLRITKVLQHKLANYLMDCMVTQDKRSPVHRNTAIFNNTL